MKIVLIAAILIALMSGIATADRWDWREHGGTTPTQDDGPCGCCWASATIAMAEGHMKVAGYPTYDFSEESLKECPWNCQYGVVDCKNGGCVELAIHHLTKEGMVLESDNPFWPYDSYCNLNTAPVARVTDWDVISTWVRADTDKIKSYIRTYGAVYTKMDSSCIPPNLHKELIVCNGQEYNDPDHAVAIVGWDDNLGPGCWICKNSNGAAWGDQGYFYIEYGCAGIGFHTSAITRCEKWNPGERTLSYDEAGWDCYSGAGSQSDAWGLCKFDIGNELITDIEFWTTGETNDVDLYLYDNFNGVSFGNLLYSDKDLSFCAAGYHSVEVFKDIRSTTGTIVVVAHINNMDSMFHSPSMFPIVGDDRGKIERDRTYMSRNGVQWVPMNGYMDVALRLRILGKVPTPTIDRSTAAAVALGLATREEYDPKYDMNKDGEITALDALMIIQNVPHR